MCYEGYRRRGYLGEEGGGGGKKMTTTKNKATCLRNSSKQNNYDVFLSEDPYRDVCVNLNSSFGGGCRARSLVRLGNKIGSLSTYPHTVCFKVPQRKQSVRTFLGPSYVPKYLCNQDPRAGGGGGGKGKVFDMCEYQTP